MSSLSLDDMSSSEFCHLRLIASLLSVVEKQVVSAESDLTAAAQAEPIYPALLCIRYLLRSVYVRDLSIVMIPHDAYGRQRS